MFSVIIPTHNRKQCLGKALDSVLAQGIGPLEIIVIDDGSTDNTRAFIEAQYSDIRYVYQSHAGVSSARNHGITLASHEWIAFLDSDDEWLPNKLELQYRALLRSKRMVCHTDEIWIRNGRRVNQMVKHQKHGGWIYPHCLPLCAMSPSSIVIHKCVFKRVGLFDLDLPACEDYDLWLRISAQFEVEYLDKPLIKKYGGHEDQLSRKYWGMDRFRVRSLEKMLALGCRTSSDERATRETLFQKLNILKNGAQKRDNTELLTYCETRLAQLA